MTPTQKHEACRRLFKELGLDEVYRRLSAELDKPCEAVEAMWKAYPSAGRKRSTRHKSSLAWSRVPKGKRPTTSEAIRAIKAWAGTDNWAAGYVPGLHIWIKDRAWADAPAPGKVVGFGFKAKKQEHPDLQPDTDFDNPQEAAEFMADIMNQANQ